MDMEKLKQAREERDKARKEQLATDRLAVLKKLNEQGITKVTASYEGYGDSGNAELVGLEPEGKTLSGADASQLENLVWDVAYELNPGFEINEGGNGDFTWDVPNNRINISHRAIIADENDYEDV